MTLRCKEMAEKLNGYFVSVFTEDDSENIVNSEGFRIRLNREEIRTVEN